MKKHLLALLTLIALVLAVAFAPVLANASSNPSPSREQDAAPKVEEVKLDGEDVEPIITSTAEIETSTTPQAQALKAAKQELDGAFKEVKNDKGETVKYLDYSKVDDGLKKKLDDVAKTINKDYNSSVFQVSALFEFSLPEGKVVSKDHPVTATFDAGTSEKVTVIHKVGNNWDVVSAGDTQQSGTKVTVKFTSLCPVAFLTANPNSLVPAEGGFNLLWIVLIIVAIILIVLLILLLLRKKNNKDQVVAEEGTDAPVPETDKEELMENQEVEEAPAEEEAPQEEEAPAEEEAQPEEPAEPVVLVETYDNVADDVNAENKYIAIQMNRSFLAKLAESGEECQGYYNKVKNELAAYGLKGKPAWKYENFRKGMDFPVKIQVKGKTLYLYLALEPETVDAKYKVKNVGESKKFSANPSLFKCKGPRKAKYAVELVNILGEKLGLTKGEVENVNYCEEIQGLTEAELIEKGLIKVKAERTTEVDERTRSVQIEEQVSSEESNEKLSDRDANNLITQSNRYADPTKKVQVSVETLCSYFEEAEIANLEEIKKRVPDFDQEATFLEVTGEGSANKAIVVDCDEISLEAAKMILLVGGKVMKSIEK